MTKRRQGLRRSAPKAEVILWGYLKGRKLYGYKFRRQYSVGGYVIDFYCPKLKLAIEIDGPSHFQTNAARDYDRHRQRYIESFNIKFVRVANSDIYCNIRGVIDIICRNIPR